MEFNFEVEQKLGCDNHGFCIIDASKQLEIKHSLFFFVKEIIDTIGSIASKVRPFHFLDI